MAAIDTSKKPRIYHTLYLINLSCSRIVTHCQTLHDAGALPVKYTRLYQAYAQELQAQINDDALEIVSKIEFDDLARFGRIRDARDKELRDPDDVFLLAEERRKELAKQKKSRRTPSKKQSR